MSDKKIHPAATILPLMVGDEFAALCLDIQAHGLRDPIILHQDGSILDGRNRYRACLQINIAPHYETWSGKEGDEVVFVISENIHRRHLDTGQRAMYFARFATLAKGGPTRKGEYSPLSQEALAEQANVDRKTIGAAKAVLKSNDSELIARVDSGQTPVHRAVQEIKRRSDGRRMPGQATQERINAGRREQVRYLTKMNDALDVITALPDPADFVLQARAKDLNRRLNSAATWIARCIQAINKTGDDK